MQVPLGQVLTATCGALLGAGDCDRGRAERIRIQKFCNRGNNPAITALSTMRFPSSFGGVWQG